MIQLAEPIPPVIVGSRWQPGQIERRDDSVGSFEMLNSRLETKVESLVQVALIGPGIPWVHKPVILQLEQQQ